MLLANPTQIRRLPALLCFTCITLPVATQANVLNSTDVSIGGYIKADAIWSDYSDGDLPSNSIGRDFYIPGLIPVGGTEEGDSGFDMHARQSRFNIATHTQLQNGEWVKGKLELDFMVTPDGDERVSNSYSPRIRHAYFEYDNWLVGQTWSTFQDPAALPETLDFIGVTDGTVFVRQTMVRYSHGNFSIALENPETTVMPYQGGARITADDNDAPDLTLQYKQTTSWGHYSVSALIRELAFNGESDGRYIDDSVVGGGLSLTAKINLGADDIRLMLNAGSGLGRYVALNTANGVVIDADGELETIDTLAVAVAYRHVWNPQWRSSLTYSMIDIDNEKDLVGEAATDMTHSARVNLLYSPSPEVTFGAELSYAERDIVSGDSGDMTRVQFSAKYNF